MIASRILFPLALGALVLACSSSGDPSPGVAFPAAATKAPEPAAADADAGVGLLDTSATSPTAPRTPTSTPTPTTPTGTTPTSGGTTGGGTTGGTATTPGNACTQCDQTKCSDELDTCAGTPECVALFECASPCTDDACVVRCRNAHPGGIDSLDWYMACHRVRCAPTCAPGETSTGSGTTGGTTTTGTTAEEKCSACISSSCSNEINACRANAECPSLFDCIVNCADDACVQTCANTYPNGIDGFNAFAQCQDQSCAAACQ